jgi:hypothetical protein
VIYYLVTRSHAYTLSDYLGSWGQAIAAKVRVVPYGALPANRDLPRGTYVFSDIERLGPAQRPVLISLADQLARAGLRVINHPAKSLGRHALLRRLHEAGMNEFRAFRATEIPADLRYPVFVREEAQHTGNLSSLVRDESDLSRVLFVLRMEGFDPRDLLVVEFCETRDPTGLYRKYASFRVGDRIFHRHILFSKSWVQKDLDLLEPSHILENRACFRDNPHRRDILRAFELGEIEYGRIDYGLKDGAMQVWEINTNPIVQRPPEQYDPERHAYMRKFAEVFDEALLSIDSDDTGRIPIDWSVAAR